MKILFTLILLLQYILTFGQGSYCINANELNLRNSPTTIDSYVLGKFTRGQTVEVYEFQGEWAKVNVNGQRGYMFAKYLVRCNSTTNNNNSFNNSNGKNTTYTNSNNYTKPNTYGKGVLVCDSPSSKRYHSYRCQGLNRCQHNIIEMSSGEAENKGLTPCKFCY
jgi:uncharacterized protein YgiM (DUF1202 family)